VKERERGGEGGGRKRKYIKLNILLDGILNKRKLMEKSFTRENVIEMHCNYNTYDAGLLLLFINRR